MSGSLGDIEIDAARIGIDGGLDGVAHVVARAGAGIGIGIPFRRRVAVEHPDERAVVGDDQVGVLVIMQEGREALGALEDAAINQQAALRLDVRGEQYLGLAEAQGKEQSPPPSIDGDSSVTLVGGGNVLVTSGVIELLGARAHEAIVVGQLAIIDFRPLNADGGCGDRGNVTDKQIRQAFARDLVDGAEAEAVAVRVGEVLVDPGAAGEATRR
jgi:hypothetical protein